MLTSKAGSLVPATQIFYKGRVGVSFAESQEIFLARFIDAGVEGRSL